MSISLSLLLLIAACAAPAAVHAQPEGTPIFFLPTTAVAGDPFNGGGTKPTNGNEPFTECPTTSNYGELLPWACTKPSPESLQVDKLDRWQERAASTRTDCWAAASRFQRELRAHPTVSSGAGALCDPLPRLFTCFTAGQEKKNTYFFPLLKTVKKNDELKSKNARMTVSRS